MTNTPFVSIIIPCRNEEKYIGKCLDSVVAQDFPKESLEVLVVDGSSEDQTKNIIKEYFQKYPFIKLLENPNKFTPFGLNIGVKAAKGNIIGRLDAHAQYDLDYIPKCVNYLLQYKDNKVGNVGGRIVLPPMAGFNEIKQKFEQENPGKTYNINIAKAIAICLSHPFGAASSFRIGVEKPCFVDTVFGGFYWREALDAAKQLSLTKKYFNEDLIRSQDLELNLRLKKAGWKILLVPDIKFNYYPKSNFREFFIHNFEDGIWAIYPLKFIKKFFRIRHYIPLAFLVTMGLFLLLGFLHPIFWWLFVVEVLLHAVMNIYFAIQIALQERNLKFLVLMPLAFDTRQFGYGFGSIWGLIKILWP